MEDPTDGRTDPPTRTVPYRQLWTGPGWNHEMGGRGLRRRRPLRTTGGSDSRCLDRIPPLLAGGHPLLPRAQPERGGLALVDLIPTARPGSEGPSTGLRPAPR